MRVESEGGREDGYMYTTILSLSLSLSLHTGFTATQQVWVEGNQKDR